MMRVLVNGETQHLRDDATLSSIVESLHARSDGRDLARRFRADHQRQPAFGERHAAPAPYVDMVERHRPDANLHLAGRRRGRGRRLLQLELAVGNEGQRSHESCSRGESEAMEGSAPNAYRRAKALVNERCSNRPPELRRERFVTRVPAP